MQGRRVENTGALELPGDYAVDYAEPAEGVQGEIAVLWFIMPTGMWGRTPAIGHGGMRKEGEPEPEWEITEDENGVVTVKPSIDCRDHWHGFLTAGVWSTV